VNATFSSGWGRVLHRDSCRMGASRGEVEFMEWPARRRPRHAGACAPHMQGATVRTRGRSPFMGTPAVVRAHRTPAIFGAAFVAGTSTPSRPRCSPRHRWASVRVRRRRPCRSSRGNRGPIVHRQRVGIAAPRLGSRRLGLARGTGAPMPQANPGTVPASTDAVPGRTPLSPGPRKPGPGRISRGRA
jgi:hypothetical protein